MLVRKLKDCKEFIAADGSVLREMLHPDKEDLKINYSLAFAKVMPGKTTKPHKLKTCEVYYILKGRGLMYIDKESCSVSSQDTVYIPPCSTQYIKNTGSSVLEFLCLVEPAWKKQDEEIL